tara:strand:+ start:1470 stop:2369 length:900 start_codon:yes stop_codon:yes gene_type:complete
VKALRILFLLFSITACSDQNTEQESSEPYMSDNPKIQIRLEQSIDELLKSSPLPFAKDCLEPVGMCWYEVSKRFAALDLPSVEIIQGHHELHLDQVTQLTVVINEALGTDIQNISMVVRGLPDDSPHEAQKAFIYQLIFQLGAAGWQHVYHPGDPRIPGTEADKIDTPRLIFGQFVASHPWLDPQHEPSLEHWLKVGNFYNWFFHNAGAYLHLKAQRRNSRAAPADTGTYLISLEFLSESAKWRGDFEQMDKDNWQQLLPERLQQYRQQREALEAQARQAGIVIDESYQDPPIKALLAP